MHRTEVIFVLDSFTLIEDYEFLLGLLDW